MEKLMLNREKMASQLLKTMPVKRKMHFLFNLLCFWYFRRSAGRGIETSPLWPFIIIPYVFFSEGYFFRSQRYFVMIDRRIVGLIALQEYSEAIFISVLASHPFYRKMGIASFVLDHAVMFARKRGKRSLELSVLKMNKPALSLYNEFGFRVKEEKRRSYVLQYQL